MPLIHLPTGRTVDRCLDVLTAGIGVFPDPESPCGWDHDSNGSDVFWDGSTQATDHKGRSLYLTTDGDKVPHDEVASIAEDEKGNALDGAEPVPLPPEEINPDDRYRCTIHMSLSERAAMLIALEAASRVEGTAYAAKLNALLARLR